MSGADGGDSEEHPEMAHYGPTRFGMRQNTHYLHDTDALSGGGGGNLFSRRDLGMYHEMQQPTVWQAVNYPHERQFRFQSFFLRYQRQAEARAIIDKPVNDTWQDSPIVHDEAFDDQDEPQSEFERKVENFFEGEHTRRKPIHRLNVADKLARLGQYSLLVIGTDDGRDLDTPLEKDEFDGLSDLNYMAVFGEDRITDIDVVDDMSSSRFRLPESFEVVTENPEKTTADTVRGAASTHRTKGGKDGAAATRRTQTVHHSRCIHIPEGTLENDLKGTPALKPVFHELLNIDKIKAASGEGYWRAGYQGLLVQPPTDPNTGERMRFSDDGEGVAEEIQEYIDNFERTIATRGEISTISNNVGNPSPHLDVNYEAIAAALDLPKSILTGEDRADTASSEDVRQWHQKVGERRHKFADPVIVQPLISKFVKYGLLPNPEGDGFLTEWPPLDELTEEEEWNLRSTKANVIQSLAPGRNVESLATVHELRQVLGWGLELGSEVPDEELPPGADTGDEDAVDTGPQDADEDMLDASGDSAEGEGEGESATEQNATPIADLDVDEIVESVSSD